MSTTLHAFKSYACENDEIKYLEDESVDLCASTWVEHIYPILEKASERSGCSIDIPVYDIYDSVELAEKGQLELVDPELFTLALEDVRSVIEDKDSLYYIDEVLLPRTRRGLYLVSDRD